MKYPSRPRTETAENALLPLMRDENSITRLFVALCRNPQTRRALIKSIFTDSIPDEIIDNLDINEQTHLGNLRPDIEVSGDNFYALIEVKVSSNAPLQPTQPEIYLDHIHNKHKKTHEKHFIFLIPEDYSLTEYYDRKKRFQAKHPSSLVTIKEIRWSDLISKLEKHKTIYENLYLNDFYYALRNYFYYPKPAFTQEQLAEADVFTTAAAESLINIFKLIHGLNKKLSSNGFDVGFYDSKNWWNGTDYGIYLDLINNKHCYFYIGLWMHYWRNYGSPLSISINDDSDPKTKKKFRSVFENNFTIKEEGGRYSFLVSPITAAQLEGDAIETLYGAILPFIEDHCVKLGKNRRS